VCPGHPLYLPLRNVTPPQSLEKSTQFGKLLVPKHKNRVYLCPLRVHFTWPLCVSHSLMVLSTLPLASTVPSGLHETALTLSECPLNVDTHCPICAFQTLIVLSSLALAIFVPSRVHATDLTLQFTTGCVSTRSNSGKGRKLDDKIKKKSYQSKWPLRVDFTSPLAGS
jgi:hypothetical protein